MKKLSYNRLYNKALFYLSRYSSSTDNLKQVLYRACKRSELAGDDVPSEAEQWIEDILKEFTSLGYLNDSRYLENTVRSLVESGKSFQFIARKLAQKGFSSDEVSEAFGELDLSPDESDMRNAFRLVKKKKIGPWRSDDTQEEFYQKDLAVLARAGFSFAVAQKALKDLPEN